MTGSKLTSDTWYMYIVMVAMETELACDLRYLLSGPSLANSMTNIIGSSTQMPNNKISRCVKDPKNVLYSLKFLRV